MTNLLLLDMKGVLGALAIGLVVLFAGGANGFPYLILLLVFLISGVIATRYDEEFKRELGIYEYGRSLENVVANGIVPVMCSILTIFSPFGIFAYVGTIAAITADKFSSEIGVLGGDPYFLWNLKKVKRGTSGAVSPLGFLASFNGGALIGFAAFLLFPQTFSLWSVFVIGSIGLVSSFIDSLFGILENNGIGSKATTNIICSVAGAILGMVILS